MTYLNENIQLYLYFQDVSIFSIIRRIFGEFDDNFRKI